MEPSLEWPPPMDLSLWMACVGFSTFFITAVVAYVQVGRRTRATATPWVVDVPPNVFESMKRVCNACALDSRPIGDAPERVGASGTHARGHLPAARYPDERRLVRKDKGTEAPPPRTAHFCLLPEAMATIPSIVFEMTPGGVLHRHSFDELDQVVGSSDPRADILDWVEKVIEATEQLDERFSEGVYYHDPQIQISVMRPGVERKMHHDADNGVRPVVAAVISRGGGVVGFDGIAEPLSASVGQGQAWVVTGMLCYAKHEVRRVEGSEPRISVVVRFKRSNR